MAHYSYKDCCYDIDYPKFQELIAKFEEAGNECDHDSNYDGDYWLIAAMWINELRETVKAKEVRIAELESAVKASMDDRDYLLGLASKHRDELEAENARLRQDAERWNAFLNCGRIKLQGFAGVNTKPGDLSHNDIGYVHFGGEFWTNTVEEKYYNAEAKAKAQEVLIAFADGAIKTAQLANTKE